MDDFSLFWKETNEINKSWLISIIWKWYTHQEPYAFFPEDKFHTLQQMDYVVPASCLMLLLSKSRGPLIDFPKTKGKKSQRSLKAANYICIQASRDCTSHTQMAGGLELLGCLKKNKSPKRPGWNQCG